MAGLHKIQTIILVKLINWRIFGIINVNWGLSIAINGLAEYDDRCWPES